MTNNFRLSTVFKQCAPHTANVHCTFSEIDVNNLVSLANVYYKCVRTKLRVLPTVYYIAQRYILFHCVSDKNSFIHIIIECCTFQCVLIHRECYNNNNKSNCHQVVEYDQLESTQCSTKASNKLKNPKNTYMAMDFMP